MLPLFSARGQTNSRNEIYQFWQQDNHPEELYSSSFVIQKMNYIHNNPVAAGIVEHGWQYLSSSAKDYHLARKYGLLDVTFL